MEEAVSPPLLQDIFEAQGATALAWRGSSALDRRRRIARLREAVLDRREDWYRAAHEDFGKSAGEVDLGELLPFCLEANWALRHLDRWMRPRRVRPTWMTLGTRAEVQFQPRGRCLIIGPFNYPINLTLSPLVSALAAGNTAIVKPSELTPAMSGLLAQVIAGVFAPQEVAVFEGSAEMAQALQELPFDHIHFTGSTAVGKKVMASAARHLASVTLELGGKTPAVVDASADLLLAARNIVWAKFANAGQTCIAPDHVFVHASVKDRWIELCRQEIERAYGSALAEQEKGGVIAHIVNQRHAGRLRGLLEDAGQRGAHVLLGGQVSEQSPFMQPTLLTEPSPDARLMREEIFGPLLPVLSFEQIDTVVDRINASAKPLALYIYSRTPRHVQQLVRQTSSGGVCINHALIHYIHGRLPFGGVNDSGLGQSRGFFGFRAFSHERSVLQARWAWLVKWMQPGLVPPLMRRFVRWGWRYW
jgi:aldehyde dehydrogenase (NAD+)